MTKSASQAELEKQQREWEAKRELENLEYEWETKSVEKAVERYKKISKSLKQLGLAFELLQGNQILGHWFEPLCAAIRAEQNAALLKTSAADAPKKGKRKTQKAEDRELSAYLVTIPPEKLAVITIHETMCEILKSHHPEGAPFGALVMAVGRAVEYEYNCERLAKEGWKPQLRNRSATPTKQQICALIRTQSKAQFEDASWGAALHAKVGSLLVKQLLDTATIARKAEEVDVAAAQSSPARLLPGAPRKRPAFVTKEEALLEPAFNHHQAMIKGKLTGFLRCHEQVLALMEHEEVQRGVMQARYMPMLVEPQPWVAPNQGGYLVARTQVLRAKGSRMQTEVLRSASMDKVYECLNLLSSTPWRINNRMHEVICEAWDNGGGIADLPCRTNLPELEPPADYYSDLEVKQKFDRERKKVKIANCNLHSLRCDVTYKLQVAKECQDRTFYYPHNMDFRGRTYPIPPHLNHLGQDLCRGLLTFAEGKPLGESGLRWLKVHLANVFGNDKITFEDRVRFVETNMEHIKDSASNPLGGQRWWLKADKPWQCLAASIELINAYNSGQPETYVSTLPIHQDGSCNGLQHYAALGGDELGARQVNLLPSERPQDVYSGVVELVVRRLEDDAANGVEIARRLQGKVDRKVIKQTVMTSVYGVTFIGARQQIENALKDKGKVSDEDMFLASRYLATSTFSSIKEMFSGAREIMTWLSDCATLIAKQGKPVTWVTPMGLPVVQPYRTKGKQTQTVVTALQNVMLVKEENDSLPVNTRKQRTAFPPNYVHSLDSTHMMLTALQCHEAGLTYASVHDSYWTHASSVDTMNHILRRTFVDLHSQPLLDDLLAHFKRTYPGIEFPPVPPKGDLDLKEILNSPYFFQ